MRSDMSDIDMPNISLYPSTTNFYEHKRCFKTCIKDMSQPYFTEKEEACSKNCLSKYIQAQIFVSQKMKHQLTQLISQDPRIKMAFKKPMKLPQQRPGNIIDHDDDDDE